MAEYKRLYTKEEIDDLLQWFAQRYDRLPERIALRRLCEMVETNCENPTFGACIRHVFRLRERLIEDCGL